MKKKALIVVNLAGFLHFLWNDIATLQEMGYEVSVAMNENSAAGPNLIEIPKLEEMGIAHYQVEFDTKSPVSTQNIQAYKQLKLILKTNKYDLIHCHTPIVGILTRMAARKYRKTGTIVIYTTHGFTFTDKSSKKNWIVYFTAEKLMSRFCDAIITINHEDYNNAKKMHCPKTYIIPSVGLDNHRFANLRINRDEYRASFGVNSKDHMILAVGELSSRKNQKIIIEALGTLDRKEQYIFVICGTAVVNSTIEEELKETASKLGVRIFLAGHRLDIPEISLVAILDADKEGFLRSETSLIQTIGRAARNSEGKVIMYADTVTGSMERAITETERRRSIQMKFNEEHGIVPKTIIKEVRNVLEITSKEKVEEKSHNKKMSAKERSELIASLTEEMKNAAKMLEFEHAAYLRDKIKELKGE